MRPSKKTAILDAALRVAAAGGGGLSIETVAQEAGVTKTGVLYHPVAGIRHTLDVAHPGRAPRPVARCWELRHNLTAYDAAYLAIAESIAPRWPRVTAASLACGPRCPITTPPGIDRWIEA